MATIGFEEELWASADKLRNNMDAAEYKHVVLGLIFLKYVSDTFMEKYKELLEEDEDFAEDEVVGECEPLPFLSWREFVSLHFFSCLR